LGQRRVSPSPNAARATGVHEYGKLGFAPSYGVGLVESLGKVHFEFSLRFRLEAGNLLNISNTDCKMNANMSHLRIPRVYRRNQLLLSIALKRYFFFGENRVRLLIYFVSSNCCFCILPPVALVLFAGCDGYSSIPSGVAASKCMRSTN
jgi:hypothetical protein